MSKQMLFAVILLFVLGGFSNGQEHLGRARIHGTVVDESGAPVEGALVEAQILQGTTKLEGKSDQKGRFAIGGLGGGMWRVTASKSGYASASVEIKVSQLSANPAINLVLRKLTDTALTSDKEVMSQFDRGNALLSQGDVDGALKIFEEFVLKYPELFQVHLNIGTCYFKKGELDRAESEFKLVLDRVLTVSGDYSKDAAAALRGLTGLGEIALRRDDLEAAQEYFSRGLEISPQDETAAYNVGEILFSNQKVDEAIRYFELAAQIKKDWPKPHLKLGYAYLNKGDFDKALRSFNDFIKMSPEDPEVSQVKSIVETIEKMKKQPAPRLPCGSDLTGG
ncbi:MAG: tetratricopeptide repeat protein [Acidobacteriota bacterium]